VGLCRQEATCEVVWAGRAWLKSDSELGPREVFCGKVLWGAMGSEIQAGRRILGLRVIVKMGSGGWGFMPAGANCEVALAEKGISGPREVFCGKVLWGAMGSEIQAGRRILGLCRGYRDL
jgi:hypothetical protein